MSWFVERLRAMLLFGDAGAAVIDLAWVAGVLLLFWVALAFFRRLSGHFEDFL